MSTPNASAPLLPRHLLCGLDVEGRAHPAVQAAVWLAETLGAEVEFTHAFPPRPLLWGKKDDMPEWVAGTEAAGRVLRESLREALRQAPTELGLRTNADALRFHVASGHPAHVLLDHARTSHADLIVLGPHQKHGRLDFGGTARGVLAHAAHGVWVQPARPKLVKRILVPVDLSETSLAALRLARDLAQRFGAKLTAMQAFLPPTLGAMFPSTEAVGPGYVVEHLLRAERDQFEAAMSAFDWRGVAHATRFEQGEPAEVVLELQKEHDLIVLGTHGRTGLSAALLGSVAQAVLRSSTTPVLALRQAKGTFLI
ncbi:MAG: universal stress protein [Planctomycetes bacterium]|nr:universal stress protein [Planctomycetota bacterium]